MNAIGLSNCEVFTLCFVTCFGLNSNLLNVKTFETAKPSRIAVLCDQPMFSVLSSLHCASLCGRRSRCLGYSYSDTQNICYVGTRLVGKNSNGMNTFVSALYVVKDTVRCGIPPKKPNSKVSSNGDVVGSVANYTCDVDYRLISKETTSICQPTGKWYNGNVLCQRFRWIKPKLEGAFNAALLPCEETGKFYVKVKGIPTHETEFGISMKRRDDTLFLVSSRFRHDLEYKQIMVNTRFGDAWGKEMRFQRFPFYVRKTFLMEVTYADGTYQMKVDKSHLLTFKERYSGVKPDTFGMRYDVSLQSVEIHCM